MNTQPLAKFLKQYPLAIIGGLLCLILAATLFVRWDRLAEMETAYEEIDRESELIRHNEINAVNLATQTEALEEYVAGINARLMYPDARTDHYRYFLGLAEQSGVSLDEPALAGVYGAGGGGVETTQYGQIEYSLKISGGYPKLLECVRMLLTGQYIARIDRLEISPVAGRPPQDRQASVDIRVRFLAHANR